MATNTSNRMTTIRTGLAMLSFTALMAACGGGATTETPATTGQQSAPAATTETEAPAPVAGLITADEVKLGPIDQGMVAKGKEIYDVKCQACHSLGTNRVVGPGWKGVVEQRKPEWIMNMIVHTDAMLESDAEAQALLEECLVRMPNQNLSKEDARNVLEFMRTL
jgi:mono/diheme cytochrome c family protein